MKEALLQLRAELLELAATGDEQAAVVELDQAKVGRLSRMDALQAQAMAREAVRRREDKLREIAAALKRLEADEYGFCLSCDEAINPQRIAVDPTVRYCIDCANKAEGVT